MRSSHSRTSTIGLGTGGPSARWGPLSHVKGHAEVPEEDHGIEGILAKGDAAAKLAEPEPTQLPHLDACGEESLQEWPPESSVTQGRC